MVGSVLPVSNIRWTNPISSASYKVLDVVSKMPMVYIICFCNWKFKHKNYSLLIKKLISTSHGRVTYFFHIIIDLANVLIGSLRPHTLNITDNFVRNPKPDSDLRFDGLKLIQFHILPWILVTFIGGSLVIRFIVFSSKINSRKYRVGPWVSQSAICDKNNSVDVKVK